MTGPDKGDLPYLKQLSALAAPEAHGYHAFHDAAERSDGAIPEKYRQLAMLAVALTTQCGLCIENHTAKAREAGATRQEVSEIVYLTAAVRAGGAVAHGIFALRCYEMSKPLA